MYNFFFFFATRNHFKKMKSILENSTFLHYNSLNIKNKKKSSNKNCFFYKNYCFLKHLLIVYTYKFLKKL